MNIWLPVVAGLVIIALALGIVRLAPNSSLGRELRRSYGIQPSGPRGNRTRGDHLRSAGLAFGMCLVLIATSLAAAMAMDQYPEGTQGDLIASTYLLVSAMLAVVAAGALTRSLWKAAIWQLEIPDTPEHRRRLADAIDHLIDGVATTEERTEYLEVRYLQTQIDQVRRAAVILAAQHETGLPDHFRVQVKRWTAGIRASAESSS